MKSSCSSGSLNVSGRRSNIAIAVAVMLAVLVLVATVDVTVEVVALGR